jgi:tetratricopeptide (TPR) repeat protein
MNKPQSKPGLVGPPAFRIRRVHQVVLAVVCVLILGLYGWSARSGVWESWGRNASDSYYNQLVRGFRSGHLNLAREVPPGLAQLADPYDPTANSDYRLRGDHPVQDLSYYQGKLYLYFGVTPALLLFWPYTALTGGYLLHKDAVIIFCAVGFLTGVGLLCALWRRYFATVNFGVVVAGTVALGLTPFVPVILPRSDVYEVAISCGYALTMLALVAIWCASHAASRRNRWLVAASLAYGLALGARPSLLFGAGILLIPVVLAWRERRQMRMALLAATVPITLIGLGLMLYNYLRFDNPLEFGLRYELTPYGENRQQHFSLSYFWLNFWAYFLVPAHWSGRFPFVHDMAVTSLPKGYVEVDQAFGVLSNIPVVWLALAAPLVWRNRSAESRITMHWFPAAVAWLFGTCALVLGVHNSACLRYNLDFAPMLVFLAVIGIFGLERALAGQPVWRRVARWGWGLALAFSVTFNLLASVDRQAEANSYWGRILLRRGQTAEAIVQLRQALKIHPDNALNHDQLAVALRRTGHLDEAEAQWHRALEILPNFVEAREELGFLLFQQGRWIEATQQMWKVLEIRPDRVETHNILGVMFTDHGCWAEAIMHFQKACELRPGQISYRYNLAWLLAACPEASLRNGDKAVELAQQAKQLTDGQDPYVLRALAAALAENRRYSDAVATAQEALALAVARNNTSLAGALRVQIGLYQANQPFRLAVPVSEPAN